MKLKFKVGDKIKVISNPIDHDLQIKNYTGTIIVADTYGTRLPYLVQFDKSHPDFHNGSGKGKPGRCFWLNEDEIALDALDALERECIVIYRKGNEVTAMNKSTGKKVKAICAPEDVFDFKTGAKLAFERLMNDNQEVHNKTIEVGDNVRIADIGVTYRHYDNWSGLSEYKSHFVNDILPECGTWYKVLNIAPHDTMPCSLALIQNPNTTQVFIVAVEGLKKC